MRKLAYTKLVGIEDRRLKWENLRRELKFLINKGRCKTKIIVRDKIYRWKWLEWMMFEYFSRRNHILGKTTQNRDTFVYFVRKWIEITMILSNFLQKLSPFWRDDIPRNENDWFQNFPVQIVSITSTGQRIIVSDVQESIHFVRYRKMVSGKWHFLKLSLLFHQGNL